MFCHVEGPVTDTKIPSGLNFVLFLSNKKIGYVLNPESPTNVSENTSYDVVCGTQVPIKEPFLKVFSLTTLVSDPVVLKPYVQ